MKNIKNKKIEIITKRFLLRPLKLSDASDTYLSWLRQEEAREYISFASQERQIEEIKEYIAEHSNRDDILFLGIFDLKDGNHIGNIKYYSLSATKRHAIMGILIGEESYRGQGVATEVLNETTAWLRDNKNINKIVLGVHTGNIGAIKAYKKANFVIKDDPLIKRKSSSSITMVCSL